MTTDLLDKIFITTCIICVTILAPVLTVGIVILIVEKMT